MKIIKALFAPGKSAFFFDDQAAIKGDATCDGFVYEGKPVTEGFQQIRVSGENISVMLILENGQVAVGDCVAVQYSGSGGRDPLFLAESILPFCNSQLKSRLEGLEIEQFRKMSAYFEGMPAAPEEMPSAPEEMLPAPEGMLPAPEGMPSAPEGMPADSKGISANCKKLHTALRYGLSQALLEACALSRGITKCEVICEEYALPIDTNPVRIFGQSGDHRYEAVDKMILKGAGSLPHGLINNIKDKLGTSGNKLFSYIQWISKRIYKLRVNSEYRPNIHIDVYGTVGDLFKLDLDKIVDYLASLEKASGEFPLYIEGPVDMGEREAQVDMLYKITCRLHEIGSKVRIVADEWCNTFEDIKAFTDAKSCDMVQIKTPDLGGLHNTVEAVLYCRDHGMEAYQGGTCNETDISARACVHAAMAARPDLILAKPGMGFDEGFSIVNNEMQRIITLLSENKRGNEG